MNTILVPLDGSAQCNAALPLARTLAKAMSASITLLHVIPHENLETSRLAGFNLQRIAHELAESGIHVDSLVRHGRAGTEILDEVSQRSTVLVVMRTHGRYGVERAILGSVADQVLAHCPVPVVLMRPGERRVTNIRTLVVPVDGSPGNEVAVRTALGLARATGAAIKLVQVTVPLAMQGTVVYDYGGAGFYDSKWDDDAVASAQGYVDDLVASLRGAGVPADGEAPMAPNAAQALVDIADKHAADLIIMSTRALVGPARTLLGSVANVVVRTAHCPVVLLRETGEMAREPVVREPRHALVD